VHNDSPRSAGPRIRRFHRAPRLVGPSSFRGYVIALFYKKLTNRYMNLEAEGMKRAAESA
jgi:hypothetical protein